MVAGRHRVRIRRRTARMQFRGPSRRASLKHYLRVGRRPRQRASSFHRGELSQLGAGGWTMKAEPAAHETYYTYFHTPVGPVLLTSDGTALTGLYMMEHSHGEQVREDWIPGDVAIPFQEARQQLAAYFAGTLTEFDLPFAMR